VVTDVPLYVRSVVLSAEAVRMKLVPLPVIGRADAINPVGEIILHIDVHDGLAEMANVFVVVPHAKSNRVPRSETVFVEQTSIEVAASEPVESASGLPVDIP